MAEIDPNIPLSFRPNVPLKDINQQQSDVLTLRDMAMQLKQREQAVANQNAMRTIFGNPQNYTPTGDLTPQATQQLMTVDPAAGMKFRDDALTRQVKEAQLGAYKTDAGKVRFDYLSKLAGIGVDAYDAKIASGGSVEEANAAARMARNDAAENSGGMLSNEDIDKVKALPFQIEQASALAHSNKDFESAAEKRKKNELAAKTEQERERHDKALESATLTRLDNAANKPDQYTPAQQIEITEPDGTKRTVLAQQDKKTGQWATADEKREPLASPNRIVKQETGATLTQDSADRLADQVIAGDSSGLRGLGFGNTGAANRGMVNDAITKKLKAAGLTGADLAAASAKYAGIMSGERALGTRTANMEISANEVKTMAPLALAASETVNRTQYPNLNDIILAAEKGTGDTNVVRFGLAANALIYTYAKFLNPTGIPTDADKARATEILSTAWSKGQFSTAVDQIRKEIASGQQAIKTTKEELKGEVTGAGPKPGDQTPPPAAAAPAEMPDIGASNDPVRAYDELKSGTKFKAPDGSIRIKP